MQESEASATSDFYDMHPINENEILAKLSDRGVDLDKMTENELKDFDQDNFGGTVAVDALAERASISSADHGLDVCSGMGGPARTLHAAQKAGT